MPKWNFTKGLHDLGKGCYGYIQPDGSWGLSNAGLIVDGGESILVDTLFDLPLTAEMLATMRASVPEARSIRRLINTHANGDHTFGNQLVAAAEIIASRAAAEEYESAPPSHMQERSRNWSSFGEGGAFWYEVMGSRFDWRGIVKTPPTTVFDTNLALTIGDKRVDLTYLGPSHSRGDILVHVPGDRVVFTGDLVFVQGHPVIWEGPVANWIRACDTILAWDVETVVPGHGPITDKTGVRALKEYLEYVTAETRRRFEEGMPVERAMRDINMDRYVSWGDPERIVINVAALYREFAGHSEPLDRMRLFALMKEHNRAAAART